MLQFENNTLYLKILLYCLFFFVVNGVCGQKRNTNVWQSAYVKLDKTGQITYIADKSGNIIPDFSRVGYHHGNKSIPIYPILKIVEPSEGDSWQVIQQAIDEVSRVDLDKDGHRGTILLKRGIYKISKSLHINASGIVLRGEGDNVNETRLIASARLKYCLIEVKGNGKYCEIPNTRVKIIDNFIPTGAHHFQVTSSAKFQVGDRIIIFRPGTTAWIHALKMDEIVERMGTRQWRADEYDLSFEREITKIEETRIYIDNPIMMQMEKQFGGGEIYKYSFDGRINEVGISNMRLESVYDNEDDTEHGWIGVQFDNVENCWVNNVTTENFGFSAVSCERSAKNVTVTDVRCFDPKSPVTGGMRYSFNNNGQQNLFMNCLSRNGRHDYVTGARVCGPNVFYNCVSINALSDIGPHHRWAVGTLYDNVITDGDINIQDRGNMGSGHGWAGVTQVMWNCHARRSAVQKPYVSGNNYNIGMNGDYYSGHFKDREDGVWEGQNKENLSPRSLFQEQLLQRKIILY